MSHKFEGVTRNYDSYLAEVSRAFILNFPNTLRKYSNRSSKENQRLHDEYSKHMRFFADYWYNNEQAGLWFDAPFLKSNDEEKENKQKKVANTIASPGKKISKNLYEIVNSEETDGIIINASYNDEFSMNDYE